VKAGKTEERMAASRAKLTCALIASVLAGGVLVCVPPASACTTPVFRYALDSWPAARYPTVIFHRDKLTDEQQKVVTYFKDMDENAGANLEVQVVDLGGSVERQMQELWKRQGAAELPRIVVTYPPRMPPTWAAPADTDALLPPAVWSGPVTLAAAESLVGSPARTAMTKRLLAGEAAVWVLVECGDKNADDAAAKKLADELKKLPAVLAVARQKALEEYGPAGPGMPQEEPIEMRFTLLRLSRKDKAEQVLLAMLLLSEADLAEKSQKQPVAFPIFGRGRALYALVGEGITSENIFGVCAFLTGPCACEVKEQNPGVDMLMTAQWGEAAGSFGVVQIEVPLLPSAITPAAAPQTRPAPATQSAPASQPVTRPAPKATTRPATTAPPAAPGDSTTPSTTAPAGRSALVWGLLGAAAALVAVVAVLSYILKARSAKKQTG